MYKNLKKLVLAILIIILSENSRAQSEITSLNISNFNTGKIVFYEKAYKGDIDIKKYEKEVEENLDTVVYIIIDGVTVDNFKDYIESVGKKEFGYKLYKTDSILLKKVEKRHLNKAEYVYFRSEYEEMLVLTYFLKERRFEVFNCKFTKNK